MDNIFEIEQYNSSNELIEKREVKNILTFQGMKYVFDVMFRGGPQSTQWYIGAMGDIPVLVPIYGADDVFDSTTGRILCRETPYYFDNQRQPFITTTATPDNLVITNSNKPIIMQFGFFPETIGDRSILLSGLFVTNRQNYNDMSGIILSEGKFKNQNIIVTNQYWLRINYTFRI